MDNNEEGTLIAIITEMVDALPEEQRRRFYRAQPGDEAYGDLVGRKARVLVPESSLYGQVVEVTHDYHGTGENLVSVAMPGGLPAAYYDTEIELIEEDTNAAE